MSSKTVLTFDKVSVVVTDYGNEHPKEMTFDWVEDSNYCMLPDNEVSIDISEHDARGLIAVLKRHFDI